MARLERLTAEQEALLRVVRDEWLAHGLSIEPADRPVAEAGARLAYGLVGLPEPQFVVWLESPFAGCVGAAMLSQVGGQVRSQVGSQVRSQVGSQVRDQVRGQVWSQVGDQIWDQVWGQVRSQVGSQVRGQVRGQVGDQVWSQVWDQIRSQVRGQVRGQVGDQVWSQIGLSLWGQHDAGWLAWTDAFGRLGIDTVRAEGLRAVGRSAGWWWAFRDLVLLTERPRLLRRDNRGRLHASDGPAMLYPDGWGIWAIHGVRMPERVVMAPESLSAVEITAERNVEIRRVMIERFGADNYLRAAGAATLHEDTDGLGHPRRLLRLDQPQDEPLVMVEVTNSTPESDGTARRYMLRVPPAMATCQEAVAWTFGIAATEYMPIAET